MSDSQPLRILVLRLGAVGDLLVATAALREICDSFPRAEIWLAGSEAWTQLIWPEMWPQVRCILGVDKTTEIKSVWHPLRTTGLESEKSFPQTLWKKGPLAEANPCADGLSGFDHFFNFRPESVRFAWWGRSAGKRWGTVPWPIQFLTDHWTPWLGRDPLIHERDRLLLIARDLGSSSHSQLDVAGRSGSRPTDKTGSVRLWNAFSEQRARRWLRLRQTGSTDKPVDVDRPLQSWPGLPLIQSWQTRGLPPLLPLRLRSAGPRKVLYINPTASRLEKAWPAPRFVELCRWARRELTDWEIRLIGAPHESIWLNQISEGRLPVDQPQNLTQLQILLSYAGALLANCSSMQFFANGLGIPVMTLFGRTYPVRWGPLGLNDHCLRGPLSPHPDVFQEDLMSYSQLSVSNVQTELQKWLSRLDD